MQIVNGKWVDKFENPVDDFNFSEFKEISENVSAVYGQSITHERISLIVSLKSLNSEQESLVADLLRDHKTISKLAGY
jgi:predicted metalloendopeptidase